VAALFGKLHPLGTIPASFFFGGLLVGADKMQRAIQVPSALITVVNGLVVMFVVASDLYVRRAKRRYSAEAAVQQSKESSNQPSPRSGPASDRPASDRSPSLP
jgi:simple sugar transport system permease protein